VSPTLASLSAGHGRFWLCGRVVSARDLDDLGEPSIEGLARLSAALGEREPRVLEIRRLPGGAQAATHAVLLRGAGWLVVKRWRSTDGRDASNELARLQVAQAADVPVPMPLIADPEGAWFGCPALAMTYVDGDVVIHPQPGPWIDELATTLAAIHDADVPHDSPALDLPHAGLYGRPLPPDRFPRTPRVCALLAAVDSLQRESDTRRDPAVLLHHDFRQHNVLWRKGRVAAVVDWHDARLGPAVSDLAYLTVDLVRTNGIRAADAVVEAYEARRGQIDDLPRWQALWLASQLPWMHRWTTINIDGARPLDRSLVTRRLRSFADRILSRL
jgi:aminoglycoside phosphotransferase (APT) family kinase protein